MTTKIEKPRQLAPEIETPREAQVALDEVILQKILFTYLPDNLTRWAVEKPGELFDEYVNRLSDSPKQVNREVVEAMRKKQILPNGELSVFLHSEPTILESYLLSLVYRADREAIENDEHAGYSMSNNFSPIESIRCIRDEVRTKRFISAIGSAVEQKENTKEEVLVCDAGCGALPVLGLSALLRSEKTKVVFMESNPRSLRMAKAVIKAFGLESRAEFYNGNILEYTDQKKFDIVVSETMDSGLLNEPQTKILNYLRQFTFSDGVIIPQRIKTYIASIPIRDYNSEERYVLFDMYGFPIIDKNWVLGGEYISSGVGGNGETIRADILLNEDSVICTCCEVELFGGLKLEKFDSKITMPIPLSSKVFPKGVKVRVDYKSGTDLNEVKITKI